MSRVSFLIRAWEDNQEFLSLYFASKRSFITWLSAHPKQLEKVFVSIPKEDIEVLRSSSHKQEMYSVEPHQKKPYPTWVLAENEPTTISFNPTLNTRTREGLRIYRQKCEALRKTLVK